MKFCNKIKGYSCACVTVSLLSFNMFYVNQHMTNDHNDVLKIKIVFSLMCCVAICQQTIQRVKNVTPANNVFSTPQRGITLRYCNFNLFRQILGYRKVTNGHSRTSGIISSFQLYFFASIRVCVLLWNSGSWWRFITLTPTLPKEAISFYKVRLGQVRLGQVR